MRCIYKGVWLGLRGGTLRYSAAFLLADSSSSRDFTYAAQWVTQMSLRGPMGDTNVARGPMGDTNVTLRPNG